MAEKPGRNGGNNQEEAKALRKEAAAIEKVLKSLEASPEGGEGVRQEVQEALATNERGLNDAELAAFLTRLRNLLESKNIPPGAQSRLTAKKLDADREWGRRESKRGPQDVAVPPTVPKPEEAAGGAVVHVPKEPAPIKTDAPKTGTEIEKTTDQAEDTKGEDAPPKAPEGPTEKEKGAVAEIEKEMKTRLRTMDDAAIDKQIVRLNAQLALVRKELFPGLEDKVIAYIKGAEDFKEKRRQFLAEQARQKAASAKKPPEPPKDAGKKGGGKEKHEYTKAQLEKILADLKGKNFFDRLDVHESTTDDQKIKKSYQTKAKRFHPDNKPVELRPLYTEIFQLLAEAYNGIRDQAARDKYYRDSLRDRARASSAGGGAGGSWPPPPGGGAGRRQGAGGGSPPPPGGRGPRPPGGPGGPGEGDVRREMGDLSPNDREDLRWGIHNIGFMVEKKKSDWFAGRFDAILKGRDGQSAFARFAKGMRDSYRKDSEMAEKKARAGRDAGKITKVSNVAYLAKNILRPLRLIADATGLSPTGIQRYMMLGGMAIAR